MKIITDFIYSIILLRLLSVIILSILPGGAYRQLIRTFLNLLLIRLVLLFFMGLLGE